MPAAPVPGFPDAEALVCGYLSDRLAVPTATRVPDPRPDRWIQVRRVGGTLATVRDRPRLDLFAWGADEGDAHDLGSAARAAVHALAGTTLLGVVCYGVEEFTGPRRSDDTVTGAPRVWFTVEISLRAHLMNGDI